MYLPARGLADECAYLQRALRRRGLSAADAEDLAQEVFVVMWRRRADYDPRRPLRPWLSGIAFRLVSDFRKRTGRELAIAAPDAIDPAPDVEQRLFDRHRHGLLMGALADLPEPERALIVMIDLENRPPREVARSLSLSLFTFYARLRKARRALARAFRRRQLRPAPSAQGPAAPAASSHQPG
jgi:RNA polymerase sigma-70 factor, ECF subfamily